MTTYTFTVSMGATMLQLNRQSLDQCFDRIGIVKSTDSSAIQKIVISLHGGKTIEIEQEKCRAQT